MSKRRLFALCAAGITIWLALSWYIDFNQSDTVLSAWAFMLGELACHAGGPVPGECRLSVAAAFIVLVSSLFYAGVLWAVILGAKSFRKKLSKPRSLDSATLRSG
jgi:hypothetical protein